MMSGMILGKLHRHSPFSFVCGACGKCCNHKKIQLNPFELTEISDFLGITSSSFLVNYLRNDEPFLRSTKEGNCIFLDKDKCTIHPVRPLVCRLYPLGHHIDGAGAKYFSCIALESGCSGTIGTETTVGHFLESQDALPYMEGSALYLDLYYHLYTLVYKKVDKNNIPDPNEPSALKKTLINEWFDVDHVVCTYCKKNNINLPKTTAAKVGLHIMAIKEKCFTQMEDSL